MSTGTGKKQKYNADKIKNILINRIDNIRTKTGNNMEKVYRFEFKTEKKDILNWLKLQESDSKMFFSGREAGSIQVAGVGIAAVFSTEKRDNIKSVFFKFGKFLENFENSTRFYGGVSFADDPGSGKEWNSFGSVKFVLPRFEYITEDGDSSFAANYRADELREKSPEELKNEIGRIKFSGDPSFSADTVISSLKFLPGFPEWKKVIKLYLNKIESKEIKKIVAARRTNVIFEKKADPFIMLKELVKNRDNSAGFLFSFDGERFFTGSTPERLFLKKRRMLITEAIAGTRPRGKTGDEDRKFGEELLSSSKETREQEFVSKEISDKLKDICEYVTISKKKLLKLSTLQHLYNKIDGRLKPGISEPEILSGLFPTSAVSGLPKDIVMKIQKENEPFERGWYSGLVGFAGREESDLYVAIRSSLFCKKNAFFYSGAGIVEGSEPEKEWKETDLKIRKLLRIFNYEN